MDVLSVRLVDVVESVRVVDVVEVQVQVLPDGDGQSRARSCLHGAKGPRGLPWVVAGMVPVMACRWPVA